MKFHNPVRGGTITAGFDQPRPLGSEKPTHVHGAIDIAPGRDTTIYAPESGTLIAYIATRSRENQYWPEYIQLHGKGFPWLNYFYDTYGGILVLRAHNGDPRVVTRTHVMTHSWGNQIVNNSPFTGRNIFWIEEAETKRFPIHAVYTEEIMVEHGQPIGSVGNAGFSTGKHLHWECHEGFSWRPWADRINPEDWIDGNI